MRKILNIDPVRDPFSYSYRGLSRARRVALCGLVLAGLAFLSAPMLVGTATAADMPMNMPMKAAAAPVLNWTGCYIGINGGGAAAGSSFSTAVDPGTHLLDPADLATANQYGTGSANDLGFIGGGQVGCYYQTGAWVAGIEGDWDYFRSTPTFSNPNGTLTTGDTVTITQSLKTSSLATIRPRLGIVSDRTLIYVTGGAAFARVSYTQSYTDTLNNAVGTATDSKNPGWLDGRRRVGMGVDRPCDGQDRIPVRQVSDHQRAWRDFGYRGRGQCSARLRRSDYSDGPSWPELQVLTMPRPFKTDTAANDPAAIIRSIFISRHQAHARRHDAATPRANRIGTAMSAFTDINKFFKRRLDPGHRTSWLRSLVAILFIALAPMIVFAPSTANACACGCSVFDVGGGLLPQEDDHGGRIFTEWWHSDQNQNWIGNSKGPAAANSDKQVVTNWYTAGLEYMFNREWGIMIRVPYVDRDFTTDTGAPPGGMGIQTFNSKSVGDVEIMGMYTGFSKDMSTGIIFGLKLPSGTYTAQWTGPRHPDRIWKYRPYPRGLPPRSAYRRQCLAIFRSGQVAAAVPLQRRLQSRQWRQRTLQAGLPGRWRRRDHL